MGECLIVRRGGSIYKLPVLDANYPADQAVTIIAGNTETATFSVLIAEAGSPAEYTYQWYVNGTAVEGATNSSYTRTVSAAATDEIYCEVRNKAGVVTSRIATLNVTQNNLPVLNTSYPANVTTDVTNSGAMFKTEIIQHGNPAEYTYQWYVNDTAVSGATSSTYTRTSLAVGTYKVYCKVTNSAGTVTSRTATLTVTPLYLYNKGDQCTALTGGWKAYAYKNEGSGSGTYTPTVTFGTSSVTVKMSKNSDDGYRAGSMFTEKTIDLTKVKTLSIDVSSLEGSGGMVALRIASTKTNNFAFPAMVEITATGKTPLDVSSLSGSYYVAVEISGVGSGGSTRTVVISSIYGS